VLQLRGAGREVQEPQGVPAVVALGRRVVVGKVAKSRQAQARVYRPVCKGLRLSTAGASNELLRSAVC
jgi:hypothetical protein